MNSSYRIATDSTPCFEPGEVVWANVLNPQENRACRGKARPAILLGLRGNGWRVMGLTSNPMHRDGTPRVRITDPAALGLRPGPSFLWGRPTDISSLDVQDHVGWLDEPTAEALAGNPTVRVSAATLLGETSEGGWTLAT